MFKRSGTCGTIGRSTSRCVAYGEGVGGGGQILTLQNASCRKLNKPHVWPRPCEFKYKLHACLHFKLKMLFVIITMDFNGIKFDKISLRARYQNKIL